MEHPLDRRRKRQLRKWADPRYALKESSKSSARSRGLEHTIRIRDITIPTHCPVFGIELKAGGTDDNSMSIDRVDSSRGYVPGNVQVISFLANRLKQNATIEQLEKILQYMKNNQ